MSAFFETKDLSVGYKGRPLVQGINISLQKGMILTLIGPNGAGKTTILRTVTRQIASISGRMFLDGKDITGMNGNEFARRTAVVLTEKGQPEMMSCEEVTAMGRYPYTGWFGKLSASDRACVREALEMVHALDIADQDFSTLSDGQRQRIMLARAICQEPELIILDEPTAYLDIRYKLELLEIITRLARERNTAVLLSLHEIDLAAKVSDEVLCIKEGEVTAYGSPEKVLTAHEVANLYDISANTFDILSGNVELPAIIGEAKIFVLAGNGQGTPVFRSLRKKGISFAAGILFENDIDTQAARALGSRVFTAPAFEPIPESIFQSAAEEMLRCDTVIDAGAAGGTISEDNRRLRELAIEHGLPVREEA